MTSPAPRVALAMRLWWWSFGARMALRRRPVADIVASYVPGPARRQPLPPRRAGWLVGRALNPPFVRTRCIVGALVLCRLLRQQGTEAVLVIGLPEQRPSKDAHAWVEVEGIDVGPPPGRARHRELVRYGPV